VLLLVVFFLGLAPEALCCRRSAAEIRESPAADLREAACERPGCVGKLWHDRFRMLADYGHGRYRSSVSTALRGGLDRL